MDITSQQNGKGDHKTRKISERNTMEQNTLPKPKSVFIAYVLWLFGGVFGLHHFYLHRDRHGFIWWCTFGFFGFGWISEIFSIPKFVRDANEDPRFIEKFVGKLKRHRKPPCSTRRFVGAVMMGYLFGKLIQIAIPEEIFGGIDWGFLHYCIPLGVSLAVWTVGNIGREKGALWHCLVAAYLAYPLRFVIYDETYSFLATSAISAVAFDMFSKEWRRTPPKRYGFLRRAFYLSLAASLYLSLWGCYFVFNGTITDSDGDTVPVHEAIRNFLSSVWWTDLKQTLYDTYQYGQHHGWYETWKEVLEAMDMDGERNAYKILGVSATASQAEITSMYRKLSKEFHPDKVKDATKKREAEERFMEIQQAYEVLGKLKSRRKQRNKKFNDDL